MTQNKGMPKALQGLLKRGAPRAPTSLGKIGKYELLQLVGEGGHGRVYRAVDPDTQATVAIKVLHEASPELELRMKREAYAMGQLAGTCAAEIYECAVSDSGQLYLAMEFLEGQDLEAVLAAYEANRQLLPTEHMLQVLGPVVSTLEVAHGRGIIHRDLKPQNVFILRGGQSRLVDFGLVKDLNLAKLTEAGTVAGSPSYIAPEAWAGVPDKIDHRIDVYALGVICYQILTGQKPFDSDGSMLDFILVVTTAPRPSVRALRPDLHPSIDAWASRALAVKPEDRFASVTALWDSLRAILAQTR